LRDILSHSFTAFIS